MAVSLFAANNGYLDDVPTDKVLAFENASAWFHVASKYKAVVWTALNSTLALSEDDAKALS